MRRVGIIIPSSNVVIEDRLQGMPAAVRGDMRFHIARLPVVAVDLGRDSTDQFADAALDQAVQQVCEAEVEQIVFAGTAGAWLGIDHDRAWVTRTEMATGLSATTTTLQVIDALRRVRPARLGLVTPFTADVHDRIEETFAGAGVPVADRHALGLTLSRDMADVSPERIADRFSDCIDDGCDVVLTFCTNFRGSEARLLWLGDGMQATLLDSVDLTFQGLELGKPTA
ncbi:MAG: hypothetical protein GY798_33860 [Hyphomicrobiales bacterium]|nr:hypothetical protein [Hyphomicrobiales bacterium]